MGVNAPLPGAPLRAQAEREKTKQSIIAPVWARLISTTTLFTFGGFVRQDRFNYYPSANVFADGTGLIPGGSSATLNQQRKFTNAGLRTDASYVKGKHNIKIGAKF